MAQCALSFGAHPSCASAGSAHPACRKTQGWPTRLRERSREICNGLVGYVQQGLGPHVWVGARQVRQSVREQTRRMHGQGEWGGCMAAGHTTMAVAAAPRNARRLRNTAFGRPGPHLPRGAYCAAHMAEIAGMHSTQHRSRVVHLCAPAPRDMRSCCPFTSTRSSPSTCGTDGVGACGSRYAASRSPAKGPSRVSPVSAQGPRPAPANERYA